MRNLKPFSHFVFFFAVPCERIFTNTHSTESRCVIQNKTKLRLQAHLCIFQPGNCTGLGSEGVNNKAVLCFVPYKQHHRSTPVSRNGTLHADCSKCRNQIPPHARCPRKSTGINLEQNQQAEQRARRSMTTVDARPMKRFQEGSCPRPREKPRRFQPV